MIYTSKELVEGLLSVVDKETRQTIPFKFNNVQNKYYDTMTLRDIILKSRQEGFSTLILALWLVACISIDNTAAVVISHEKEATKRLFARVKFFIENMEVKPCLKKESETELSFPKTNSNFYIGTAGARAFGHGETITKLHCSEVSRWPQPELMTGLLEAVPQSGQVVIETTANGYGDQFHQFWERAHNDGSVWNPHFFGWRDLASNRRKVDMGFKMTADEVLLAKRYNLDIEQISWRRWKILSMETPLLFPQQHPITDTEAFIRSGTGIFEETILQRYYEAKSEYERGYLEEIEGRIRFVESEGNLRIYKRPTAEARYSAGVDVMEGIELEGLTEKDADVLSKKHDWNAVVIKDRFTWEQVAVYRSQEEPDILAEKVNLLCKWYANALLCIEDNVGATLIYCLQKEYHYGNFWMRQDYDENMSKPIPKVGFRTTQKSKKTLIDMQEAAIRDGSTILHDITVIREHLAYMRTPEGKMQAPSGMTDDCVMADALATMICQRRKYIPENNNSQPERIGRRAGRRR